MLNTNSYNNYTKVNYREKYDLPCVEENNYNFVQKRYTVKLVLDLQDLRSGMNYIF